jgi:RNA polymerase sigma factor (sigma-70 family)
MSDSVTHLIGRARTGDEDAAQKLWELYSRRLAALARKGLEPGERRIANEEDIANMALATFFRRAKDGNFSRLNDRTDLWRLLAQITSNKLAHHRAYLQAKKRGGGKVRGESALEKPGDAPHLSGERPVPIILDGDGEDARAELAVENEECRRLLDLLPDDTYRLVALRRMEGVTLEEIAAELDCHRSTVERRINRIHRIWSKELPL